MKKHSLIAIGAMCICLAYGSADAKRVTVDLTTSHLRTAAVMDQSGYVLDVVIPEVLQGKELFGAYLELYVDADAVEVANQVNESPRLDIYALSSAVEETVGEQAVGTPALGVPNVVLGENRKVVRDISEIVRNYLSTPSSNHGLVIGSLSGSRDGRFTIASDVLGQGTVARLIFHYGD